jgi:hypothetical protein
MSRLDDVVRFYELLDELASRLGGPRRLAECDGNSGWPTKGVYFFFEPGEGRSTSGAGPRVVRVGTHALTRTSKASLWQRLNGHRGFRKGQSAGGGNHRGSVFRLHVGAAVLARAGRTRPTWGIGASAPRHVRKAEHPIECLVSDHIRSMPFLWLEVSAGTDGGRALRQRIEANAIGLLSNARSHGAGAAIDPPSAKWLGRHSPKLDVRKSGLWNVRHVNDGYDPATVQELSHYIKRNLA